MEEIINLMALILDNPQDLNTYRKIINFYKKTNNPLMASIFTDVLEMKAEKNGLNNSNFDNK